MAEHIVYRTYDPKDSDSIPARKLLMSRCTSYRPPITLGITAPVSKDGLDKAAHAIVPGGTRKSYWLYIINVTVYPLYIRNIAEPKSTKQCNSLYEGCLVLNVHILHCISLPKALMPYALDLHFMLD